MKFRERLDVHLKSVPFDISLLGAPTRAFGMLLMIEPEFSLEYSHLAEKVLGIEKFYTHIGKTPEPDEIDFVVIWGVAGEDINAQYLLDYAEKNKKPILIVEDGFFRSFFPMGFGEVSASLRYDDCGCYYDSNYESSIEKLLNSDDFSLSEAQVDSIRNAIKKIVDNNLTKYCSTDVKPLIVDKAKKTVLVIDQVFADMSIKLGGATERDFYQMLDDAIVEHPDKNIVVKLHPEAVLGIRKGHFSIEDLEKKGLIVITDNTNSLSLIKSVDIVYCVTTQMGFEAIMCGKDVTVYGQPFYSGWGITNDKKKISRRDTKRNIYEVFYAAYIYHVIYFHPDKNRQSTLEEIIQYFIDRKSDVEFISGIKNKRLELRIRRLESKVNEIDPLKNTAITLDKHIYEIKESIFYSLGKKLERVWNKILSNI